MARYVNRHSLPTMIRRGFDEALTVNVYDDAGNLEAASGGTVDVFAGSTAIVSGGALQLGGTATHLILGTQTADLSLADDWLIVWNLTIDGEPQTYSQPAYLVRRVLDPVLIDDDLTELHSDLLDLIDPDQSTFETQREAAWLILNKRLIALGRRPQLIIDSWMLRDVHRAITLEIIFRDFGLSVGDGRYSHLADHYAAVGREEFDSLRFRYDSGEDGHAATDDAKAAVPVVYLSGRPRGGW